MQNKEWLSLAEYSSRYKVSISTLRRRIKAKKAENIYEDGKYFLKNCPLKDHKFNNTFGELTPHQYSPNETVVAPPHNYHSLDLEVPKLEFVEEPYKKEIDRDSLQPNVSANVEMLLQELKNAYTLILKEKEEQVILLKDEITDLKMLTKALEGRCEQLESQIEKKQQPLSQEPEVIHPQQVEFDYIPTPHLELASDWLDDDL